MKYYKYYIIFISLIFIPLFSFAIINFDISVAADASNESDVNTLDVNKENAVSMRLGQLFILDQLFSNDDDFSLRLGSDEFGAKLGQLFVLDRLFRNNSNGLLNPDGTDLADIFILDQLFFRQLLEQ